MRCISFRPGTLTIFAPFHPNQKNSSFAMISPIPAITPVMNGKTIYVAIVDRVNFQPGPLENTLHVDENTLTIGSEFAGCCDDNGLSGVDSSFLSEFV